MYNRSIARSSKGRTEDFESFNLGSIPSLAARFIQLQIFSKHFMKNLKFKTYLANMIIAGQKWATWRIFDDKDLTVGDILEFINKDTMQVFANAEIVSIKEKILGSISDADFVGHEKFESKEEMYKIYKSYYGDNITPDTIVKMVTFKLIK